MCRLFNLYKKNLEMMLFPWIIVENVFPKPDMSKSSSTNVIRFSKKRKGGVCFKASKTGILVSEKGIPDRPERSRKHIVFDDDGDDDCDNSSGEDLVVNVDNELFGYWGTHGFDGKFWPDEKKPVVKFKTYEDLKLNRKESRGYLSDRVVASCSSYLDKCPGSLKYALCKCALKGKNLKNISILYYHHFLQYVDLSFNNLKDVSALSGLPYLMYLNVSHNRLKKLLSFEAPKYLTFVDYSYNCVRKMSDLSAFWSIKVLNLSYNFIEVIQGLENLRYLWTLDLSHNCITRVQNLSHLRILTLNLSYNRISSFEHGENVGLHTMALLSYLRLGHNRLSTLKLFENCAFLQSLSLEDNLIEDVVELTHLKTLRLLVYLNLKRNAVRKCEDYERACLNTVQHLNILDDLPVELFKKVEASSKLEPTVEQRAARDFTHLILESHFDPSHKNLEMYMRLDASAPLLVLVAPVACNLQRILDQLVAQDGRVIRLSVHTTKPRAPPADQSGYIHVTHRHFNRMVCAGAFLMVYERFGYMYGLGRCEVWRGLSCPGKVMITDGDLQGGLTLRLGGLRARLVLALPSTRRAHKHLLTEMYTAYMQPLSFQPEAILVTKPPITNNPAKKYMCIYMDMCRENCPENCLCYKLSSHSSTDQKLNTSVASSVDETDAISSAHYKRVFNEFYNEILDKRDEYLDYHNKHPGVFYDTIVTDEMDVSMEKLNRIVSELLLLAGKSAVERKM